MANLAWRGGYSHSDQTFGASSLNVSAGTLWNTAPQAGDVAQGLFMAGVIAPSAAPTIGLPPDWLSINTATQSIAGGAFNMRMTLARKVLTGSDSFTFTSSVNAALQALIGAWDNPKAGDPFHTSTRATFSGTANGAATSITTVEANQLAVYTAFTDGSTRTWTPPSGMVERIDAFGMTLADAIQVSAGATGTKTGTASAAGTGSAYLATYYSEAAAAAVASAHFYRRLLGGSGC
jgi:hypothetical protein